MSPVPRLFPPAAFSPTPFPQATTSAPRAIPHTAAPVDALRAGGAVAFKQTSLSPHPAEAAQATQLANEWGTEQRLAALSYGAHAAMERRMDRAALSQIQRLPGGPASSHAMLDGWLGRDGAVGWEDVLSCAFFFFSLCIKVLDALLSYSTPPPTPFPLPAVPELRPTIPRQTISDAMEPK